MRKGAAICPVCGFTIPNPGVREQLAQKTGGADTARLICVVVERSSVAGRTIGWQLTATRRHSVKLLRHSNPVRASMETVTRFRHFLTNRYPVRGHLRMLGDCRRYRIGVRTFRHLYSARQKLTLHVFARTVQRAADLVAKETGDSLLAAAIATCVSLVFSKMAGLCSSFQSVGSQTCNVSRTFLAVRQSVSFGTLPKQPARRFSRFIRYFFGWRRQSARSGSGCFEFDNTSQADACAHPLPDDSAECISTDPPTSTPSHTLICQITSMFG